MNERRYQRFLQDDHFSRSDLLRLIDHHKEQARSTARRATDQSRARHAMIARRAQEEETREEDAAD
jgi:hypothetical protein